MEQDNKDVSEKKQANGHDAQTEDAEQEKSFDEAGKETHDDIEINDIKIQETNEQNKQVTLQPDRLLDSHTKVIEYLCEILGNAVTKTVRESLIYEIYKDITVSNSIFKNKENFKLSLLKSLLDSECFDEYKLYFTDPEKCFKKWMCFL